MRADFDVVVIGGGHSGSEACVAAARLGCSVLLVTSSLDTIGQMSCNPAVGGIAKGTVAREVDALGGLMGRATDAATIQFRMLNRSKGPAVWAPRAQCDRISYRLAIQSMLRAVPNVSLLAGTVRSLLFDGRRAAGVTLSDQSEIRSKAVVVTAGTFLRGQIHIGLSGRIAAGRAGDPAATELAQQLESIGLTVARFKTGTPPRIDGRTVEYGVLERQDGEMPEFRFSHFVRSTRPDQRPCWITWVGEEAQGIVLTRLRESALYGGAISGRGPRYCPSIEDKFVKFPGVSRHQVFLEPEGLDTTELYVNGMSTSLPADVQQQLVNATPGLERAVVTRAGYAIEYDYYPPQQLTSSLEVRQVPGLFFAGQINGTTGYEEAAAQGVVAGLNAACGASGRDPVVLSRADGYIGVLIDDLVSRGVDEPYRLFTSRAEFRLLLRQDNALSRLFPIAERLGMLTESELEHARRRLGDEGRIRRHAETMAISPELANPVLAAVGERPLSEATRIAELVRRPRVGLKKLLEAADQLCDYLPESIGTAEIELKYAGYLSRERLAAQRIMQLYEMKIPLGTRFDSLSGLSTEAREKLARLKPGSIGAAAMIPGVSPSDIQMLVTGLSRAETRHES